MHTSRLDTFETVVVVAFPSLTLTPSWSPEPLLLVRITDAIRLCRDGGHAMLPSHAAIASLAELPRQRFACAREFASRVRLTLSLPACSDVALARLLLALLRAGQLAVLRECDGGDDGQDDRYARQKRLVRALKARVPRLHFAGRDYRLVVDRELNRLPDRESYAVVGRKDAVLVLHGVAEQSGQSTGEVGKLLDEAIGLLSADWRPPLSADGLVLLRRLPQVAATKRGDEPPITPSQLRRLADPVDVGFDEEWEPDDLMMLVEVEDPDLAFDVETDAGDDEGAGVDAAPASASEAERPAT